jgi:hypothetical protein
MNKVWLMVLLLSSSVLAISRDELVLPARHAMMRIFEGDINNNGRSDAIVLARSWDEAANPDAPRPMLEMPNGS